MPILRLGPNTLKSLSHGVQARGAGHFRNLHAYRRLRDVPSVRVDYLIRLLIRGQLNRVVEGKFKIRRADRKRRVVTRDRQIDDSRAVPVREHAVDDPLPHRTISTSCKPDAAT